MKIWTGMFGIACVGSVEMLFAKIDVVNNSGAVSPIARAMARTVPVRIPPSALGITIPSTVRALVAPSAAAPSR